MIMVRILTGRSLQKHDPRQVAQFYENTARAFIILLSILLPAFLSRHWKERPAPYFPIQRVPAGQRYREKI